MQSVGFQPSLSIAIVSNRGADAIRKAIESVRKQDASARLQVVVVGDNPEWQPDEVSNIEHDDIKLDVYSIKCSSPLQTASSVLRVSRLRNVAVSLCDGEYISFLDDDNLWESNHLRLLLNALYENEDVLAAHSWRRIVDPHGQPWIGRGFPWGFDEARKSLIYKELLAQGIMSPTDNIFRDRINVEVYGEEIATVDMGSWLFRRVLFDRVRFEVEYTDQEIVDSITEDDKLLEWIRTRGIATTCNEEPSLIYRIGGYSNAK